MNLKKKNKLQLQEKEEYCTWSFNISSEITSTLEPTDIQEIFDAFYSKEYHKIREEYLNFNRKIFDSWLVEFPVAIWQIKKFDELECKFIENVTIENKGNSLVVTTKFKIGFPSYWKETFVLKPS